MPLGVAENWWIEMETEAEEEKRSELVDQVGYTCGL